MSHRSLVLAALRLSLAYFLFGFFWILLSDKVLEMVVPNYHLYANLQTIKGWCYVAFTALLFGGFAFVEMRNQERLRSRGDERELRYRVVVESSPEGIFTIDADSLITYVNPGGCLMFGATPEELVGRRVTDLLDTLPEDRGGPDFSGYLRDLRMGKVLRRDLPLRVTGGKSLWCRIIVNPLFGAEGGYAGAHALVIDIQSRRDYEARILEALGEKEALLRELNHRVKNNLQLLASLLSLRIDRFDSDAGREVLVQHLCRVKTISLVYDRFQESESSLYVNFSDFVQDAVAEYSFAYGERGISFECHAEPGLRIAMDAAVPLALAVDEAVQNAVAHAFSSGVGGTVRIGAREEGASLAISVQDDGTGVSPVVVSSGETLGITVLHGLAEQLGGVVSFHSPREDLGRGTSVEFVLPLGAAARKIRT